MATERRPWPRPSRRSNNAPPYSKPSLKATSLRPTRGKPPNSCGCQPTDLLLSLPPKFPPSVATRLSRGEQTLRDTGLTSTWRLLPDIEIGVVALPGPAAQLDRLADALSACATGRVGISPPYTDLRATPQALTLARIALSSTMADRGVTAFDRNLLAAAAVGAPDVMNHLSQTALSGLDELPDKERVILLDTFEAWLDNSGSAQAAAETLYVHRNTVHHRLRKLEQHTGQDLSDPRSVALLTLAFENQRRQGHDRASEPAHVASSETRTGSDPGAGTK